MADVHMLRAVVNQTLTAAAEEIFGLFEKTIAAYEQELCRQRRLLQEAVDVHGSPAVLNTKVKKVTVIKEVPPVLEQLSTSLDQEDPKPPLINEEEDRLWTSQEGNHLQELKQTESKFPYTSSSLGNDDDDDKEKAQFSQAEDLKTEAGGGPEPDAHLQPDATGTESEDRNHGLEQSMEPQSGLERDNAAFNAVDCSEYVGERLGENLEDNVHTGDKTFTCSFCGKKFTKSSNLTTHLRVHTGEKPFTCSVCNTSFSLRCTLVNHMRVHTGEKPFSCSNCGKKFSKKANLTTHMALHAEEKPFKCSMCDRRFTWHSQVKNHKCAVDSSR